MGQIYTSLSILDLIVADYLATKVVSTKLVLAFSDYKATLVLNINSILF